MSTDELKLIIESAEMKITGTAMDNNPNNTVSKSEESVIENTEAMDTDIENDESNIQQNWNVGDEILCQWSRNQNIYYEGKITKVDSSMGQPRYFVHYKGWGAKHDETFLHEEALKRFQPATEELKRRAKKAIDEERNRKSKNKRSITICSTVSGKSTDKPGTGNHKSKKVGNASTPHSRSNDRNGSKKRSRFSLDMSNIDIPVSSRPVRPVKMRMEYPVKNRETEITPIKLTNSLFKVMNCDKNLFFGFSLPTIPARYSIDEILKQYYESMTNDAHTRREFGSKLQELFNLYIGDYVISNFEAPMYVDILQGKEPYFYGIDRCRPKYLESAKISKENDGSVKMSSLFGLPHLLRFLHTAHVICQNVLSRPDTEQFLRWAAEFVKFLDAHVKIFFDKEQDFYPAALPYMTRFHNNKSEYQWK